jgi:ligand-binding SRPBCC domain-containing protein
LPIIKLTTEVNNANIEIVFDLIRSIDLHKISAHKSKAAAIAGKTSGLISLNESVTWSAKYLGFTQELTSKITDYIYPTFFANEMVKGAFKSFRHEHYLTQEKDNMIVKDVFDYTAPSRVLGKLVDFLFLEKYMTNFLKERNLILKYFSETAQWKKLQGIT